MLTDSTQQGFKESSVRIQSYGWPQLLQSSTCVETNSTAVSSNSENIFCDVVHL